MSGKKKKKRVKKAKAEMNEMTTDTTKTTATTTTTTTINSETDRSCINENLTTETNTECTENTDSEYESNEETTSAASSDEASSSDEEITPATASKRRTSVLSSPEFQPKSKIINMNTTELTPEEEDSLELTDSDRLVVDESRSSNKLNSTHSSAMDVSVGGPREDPQNSENGPKIMDSYTLVLPTLKELMDKEGLEGKTKEERIAKKGNYARAVLNSPLASRKHTVEKERQHQEREKQKSLYCTYETAEGKIEFFSNVELLQATTRHIGSESIQAFYKIREGVFIIVLRNSEIKGTFPQETNFQDEIRGKKVNFRLLHNKPDSRSRRRYQDYNDEDTVYITLFLPTLISDAAVKRLFTEFGDVYDVFPGRYKKEHGFGSILNGKRHVRMRPNGSKQDLPHRVQFEEGGRYFHVMWAEKLIYCKRCSIHHMLKEECSKIEEARSERAVYKEDGITYDTRPLSERMSSVLPETVQSTPQVEDTKNCPEVATTTPHEIPQDTTNSDTPITGETDKTSPEVIDCTGSPGHAGVPPVVSTNNAETPEEHTGDLGHTSGVDPPDCENVLNSNPNPDPDKVLEATQEVATKTLFRNEDLEPS